MDNEEKSFTTENSESKETEKTGAEKLLREEERRELKREQKSEKNSRKVERMLEKKRRKEHKAQHGGDLFTDVADTDVSTEPDEEPQEVREKPDTAKDERLKEKNSKKLKKLIDKQRRREENTDRKVLTFEDMPLDEREDKQKSTKRKLKKKRVILAAAVLLVLVFVVFIFTNSDKLSMHNISNFIQYGIFNRDSDQRFPVTIQGENISSGDFIRMGQDLCYASGTKVETLNNYGKRMLTVQHGYSKPILVGCDKYSLVYNLGGTGFQVNGLDEHLYTGEADHEILVADIINNGTYALVTRSDGYLSKLFVYDDKNTKIFSYSFADYYITSVSLRSNGKKAVLSGISAHNGSEISSLYVLDFTKETPAQFVEMEDTVIYEVKYLTDTYAAAIGSNGAYVLNTGSGEVKSTDFEGKLLTAYHLNTDTDTFSISLSRSGDGRNCDVYSFSSSGSLSDSFSTDLRVIALSTYKNRVALLTTDTIWLYSKGGSLIGSADAGIDPRSLALYTSSDAYLLDTSEIRSISI